MRGQGKPQIVVVGGGPAGLIAAEVAAMGGAKVTLCEAKASVGRKLLVAGRGGLNLTHGEDMVSFVQRYRSEGIEAGWWADCLSDWSPKMLRDWAAGLGIETFEQRTGRVYPREMKAAPLLRRWVARLRQSGVVFCLRHQWVGIEQASQGSGWELLFQTTAGSRAMVADAVIFAMGGASWSITGSDGRWAERMRERGMQVAPWQAANCGWEVDWPSEVLAVEGKPIKNAMARAGEEEARGELMVTRYGLEGGIIYQLGPALRAMSQAELWIDLKSEVSKEQLCRKMASMDRPTLAHAIDRWRLGEAASAIFSWKAVEQGIDSVAGWAGLVKALPVCLRGPRPIDEAISSAGGVKWEELSAELAFKRWPGVFVAGEMVDWEAPTGGYLMQGCFAMGQRAARSALAFCG
ncbi:MAG: hypothetical protein RL117_103 [Verrucomicrobiota bacterium]|jgi:uncharacterized flavoprotein (TIGR03862 family)